MDLDIFADMLFLKNREGKRMPLLLEGSDTSKDLFCMCVDLFCKGLRLLYGQQGFVDVTTLTAEQFGFLNDRMALASISPRLSIIDTGHGCIGRTTVNCDEIHAYAEKMPLSAYKFRASTADKTYVVTFEVLR